MWLFEDRREAGRLLARELEATCRPNTIVLALPPGGVVVAREIAELLGLPLEVFLAGRLTGPAGEDAAVGAVAETGDEYFDPDQIARLGLTRADVAAQLELRRQEIARRLDRYRPGRSAPALGGQHVVLVDEGAADPFILLAAIRAIRRNQPASMTIAVPVASAGALARLAPEVDRIVSLARPEQCPAVESFFGSFSEITDDDVVSCLESLRPPVWQDPTDLDVSVWQEAADLPAAYE